MSLRTSALMLICLVLSGCGGSGGFPATYPVTGSVKVNGKAIEGAVVKFQIENGKENAIGSTDSKGEYTLSMFRPADGAIAGQYKVSVSKFPAGAQSSNPSTPPPGQIASGDLPTDYAPPTEKDGGKAAPVTKSEIPEKYSNYDSSALRAVVTAAGPNRFDFDLK